MNKKVKQPLIEPTFTDEQLAEIYEKTLSDTALAFILADAANTFLMESECGMRKMGIKLTQSYKQKFNRMLSLTKMARTQAKMVTDLLYDSKDIDAGAQFSDFVHDLVNMCYYKVGNDESMQTRIKAMIFNLK